MLLIRTVLQKSVKILRPGGGGGGGGGGQSDLTSLGGGSGKSDAF